MSEQKTPETNAAYQLETYLSLDDAELTSRMEQVKREMGPRLLVLGHHYQRDSVIALSHLRGDSYKLAALAASDQRCEAIVFCGVHFMAETADILANRPERLAARDGRRVPVSLPDLAAGCSLADMANIEQVEACWAQLGEAIDTDDLLPVTYVNSTAALKAFCGRHGGIVCTSSNARAVMDWAFARRGRVLFFPDQHLARNTARAMGIPLTQMPLWDPAVGALGGNSADAIQQSRVILWKGLCSVHQVFQPEHVARFRVTHPEGRVMVHPECPMAVVDRADLAGSTAAILEAVEQSPPGTHWGIGTEVNLVQRLKAQHPNQHVEFLADADGLCPTMYRIDLPHLCWAMENLAAGTPVNVITVEPETAEHALLALQRMLEVR